MSVRLNVKHLAPAGLILAGLLFTACSGSPSGPLPTEDGAALGPAPATSAPTIPAPVVSPTETPALPVGEAESDPQPALGGTLLPQEDPPSGAALEFSTDFSRHTIPYAEILSGGPPKDGIPAIDDPQFVSVEAADAWLAPVEPVVLVQVGQEARAYPLQILTWHEIVNDTVSGLPLAITFCPLCNTAIAFERTFDGQVLDFGTTGRLRYSNLIMYDRQTETWWQQASGDAIAGQYAGAQLAYYPAVLIAWEAYKSAFPQGVVLSRETGYNRSYGRNPYSGYDDINNPPFLYRGPATPGELPAVARVLTVDLQGEAVAYPYGTLEAMPVINDIVGGEPIVVFWEPGTASALDTAAIASGRDVGSASAFSRLLDGRELSFTTVDGRFIDQDTGSEWNFLGQAVSGELAGQQLAPVVSINHFWFSWAAFKPETRIYQP